MRILNRADFLDMPAGTLFFHAIQPYIFSEMNIKDDSIRHEDGGDFFYIPLYCIHADNPSVWIEKMEAMRTRGASELVDLSTVTRHGPSISDDECYLVYELEDMLRLSEVLNAAIAMSRRNGDDGVVRYEVGDVLTYAKAPGVFRKITEARRSGYSWVFPDFPDVDFMSENSSDPDFRFARLATLDDLNSIDPDYGTTNSYSGDGRAAIEAAIKAMIERRQARM